MGCPVSLVYKRGLTVVSLRQYMRSVCGGVQKESYTTDATNRQGGGTGCLYRLSASEPQVQRPEEAD